MRKPIRRPGVAEDVTGGKTPAVYRTHVSRNLDTAGIDEIVTGAGPGGGPHVVPFTPAGAAVTPGLFAY